MRKRVISVLLAAIVCLSFLAISASARDYSQAKVKAQGLKDLGLFKGVSDTDFDLERAPTRTEALVMFIRMIGEESAAKNGSWMHPFTDVPTWADSYVGYAYNRGYTTGISATKFGANDTAAGYTYLTFMLRALYYTDGAGGDFTWDNPYTLASSIGLLTSDVNTDNFWRADAVLISWNALSLPMNGGNKALAHLLVMDGAFTQAQLDAAIAKVKKGIGTPETVDGVIIGKYICATDSNGYSYNLPEYRPSVTLKADGSFSISVNTGEGMTTGSGTWFAQSTDTGETLIILVVNTANWFEDTNYGFSTVAGSSVLYVEDGSIGITPVYSEFLLDYSTVSNAPTPTPTPSVTPSATPSPTATPTPSGTPPTSAQEYIGQLPPHTPERLSATQERLKRIADGEEAFPDMTGTRTYDYYFWDSDELTYAAVINQRNAYSLVMPDKITDSQRASNYGYVDIINSHKMWGETVAATLTPAAYSSIPRIYLTSEQGINYYWPNSTKCYMHYPTFEQVYAQNEKVTLDNYKNTNEEWYLVIDVENCAVYTYRYSSAGAIPGKWKSYTTTLYFDTTADGKFVATGRMYGTDMFNGHNCSTWNLTED